MSSGAEEFAREQQYVTRLYGRLDGLRERTEQRHREVLLQSGSTPQQRTERDGAAADHVRRLAQLNAAENGLCFGRLDLIDGGRQYVGRLGLLDEEGDYEPLLLDWRAPAARAFYVATAAAPAGVRRRRHIRTRMRTVVGLDDDALDLDLNRPGAGTGTLVGEAALLAAVTANRTGRMRDVVETIQHEQDAAIRAALAGVLVVQGGPGTGKTAVALHRAAYLLYTHRERLERRGVLIVGPNTTFLHYISHVLPGLGETGAVLRTLGELFPGVIARRGEPAAVAQIKGSAVMTDVVAAAVRARQRVPEDALEITVDHVTYRLDRETCLAAADRARRGDEPHNLARPVFVEQILDALTEQAARRLNDDPFAELTRNLAKEIAQDLSELDDAGFDSAGSDGADFDSAGSGNSSSDGAALGSDLGVAPLDDVPLLNAAEAADLRRELSEDPAVRAAIDWLWPELTPQRLLTELFASAARLDEAAPQLTATQRAALCREPGGGWSPADVPLLDEAAELLGAIDDSAERAEARRLERVAYAQGVLDILTGSLS
ncbi:MAG: HelD family protein, partial [Actinocrinis sp.]